MMMGVLKIFIAVTCIVGLAITASFMANSGFTKSKRLFKTGYILTHPTRRAMAFEDGQEAKGVRERAKRRGVWYELYIVLNGRIERLP